MKLLIGSKEISNNEFFTVRLSNVNNIFCSHRYIKDEDVKQKLGPELFDFIDTAYDELGGFKSFKDKDRFISDSYVWYITYKGKPPVSEYELDTDRIYVVSVYRQNHGLKMVGMARRKMRNYSSSHEENIKLRKEANSALIQHIKYSVKIGWAEVSDNLEVLYNRYAGKYIIDPYTIQESKIFKDVRVDIDELHYYRPLRNGEEDIRKIAFGHIDW